MVRESNSSVQDQMTQLQSTRNTHTQNAYLIGLGAYGGNAMKRNHKHREKDRNRNYLPSRLLYAQQIGVNNERPNGRQESDRIMDLIQNRLI